MLTVVVVFFFSSRRRHTRLQGDWSSDVCSSDLHVRHHEGGRDGHAERGDAGLHGPRADPDGDDGASGADGDVDGRSEERRVGKECRSRGWADHSEKKQEVKHGGRGEIAKHSEYT